MMIVMIKVLLLILSIQFTSLISMAQNGVAGQRDGTLTFSVTDERKVITREMGGRLLLRVVKERSVSQEHYGWRVEVVRKPYRRSSHNLLYHSRRTLGAHPSQVYAWHVISGEFPNERALEAWGYPVTVRVTLINPTAEGSGSDARFVSGTIKITWERKEKGARVRNGTNNPVHSTNNPALSAQSRPADCKGPIRLPFPSPSRSAKTNTPSTRM